MSLITILLILLIAAFHCYILWFEMFAWESRGPKIFRQFPRDLFAPTKAMAANQGLYNGFLAAGLLWSVIIQDPSWSQNVAVFFLGCVAVAGIFGAVTASKRIFYVQALPALVALVLVLIT
ncbi:DUF1304 domain-containing protein [Aliiroseovarius sp. F20344]|uniref:DUF1304 domain-containing protein n=1 Tax=Aliiroseovarius sp. F20344 TaxID=2926414 RepID=UPI001FF1E13C|nr:DUF1304 domain-containing protein [Aliiroseovarius sp. F20344]MCK0143664.1 DUF1304 domain-containing protein [Aliiroseovarius sp. F20344]